MLRGQLPRLIIKNKIEEDSKVAKSKTEEELKQLETYLEVCQNNRYL